MPVEPLGPMQVDGADAPARANEPAELETRVGNLPDPLCREAAVEEVEVRVRRKGRGDGQIA